MLYEAQLVLFQAMFDLVVSGGSRNSQDFDTAGSWWVVAMTCDKRMQKMIAGGFGQVIFPGVALSSHLCSQASASHKL